MEKKLSRWMALSWKLSHKIHKRSKLSINLFELKSTFLSIPKICNLKPWKEQNITFWKRKGQFFKWRHLEEWIVTRSNVWFTMWLEPYSVSFSLLNLWKKLINCEKIMENEIARFLWEYVCDIFIGLWIVLIALKSLHSTAFYLLRSAFQIRIPFWRILKVMQLWFAKELFQWFLLHICPFNWFTYKGRYFPTYLLNLWFFFVKIHKWDRDRIKIRPLTIAIESLIFIIS